MPRIRHFRLTVRDVLECDGEVVKSLTIADESDCWPPVPAVTIPMAMVRELADGLREVGYLAGHDGASALTVQKTITNRIYCNPLPDCIQVAEE